MQYSNSFKTNKKFYASSIYPYGISRSGDFTRQQSELLENHGEAYQELHNGERAPVNDEERDFVAVCREQKSPESQPEVAWMRYYKKSQEQHLRAFAGSYIRTQHDNYSSEDDWAMSHD